MHNGEDMKEMTKYLYDVMKKNDVTHEDDQQVDQRTSFCSAPFV